MNYHAHLYFKDSEKDLAQSILTQFLASFGRDKISFHKLFAKPVGPHPTGMIEVNFGESSLNEIKTWLSNNCPLSCLIHEDTGDDYRDHTKGATWIGAPVSLDFEFFEKIKSKPNLKIH